MIQWIIIWWILFIAIYNNASLEVISILFATFMICAKLDDIEWKIK